MPEQKPVAAATKGEHDALKQENLKQQAERKQADGDQDNSFTKPDKFDNPAEKFLANTQTALDGQGIERIVSPNTGGFVPAPLEATDEQKKAMKRFESMFDSASKTRQSQLTGEIKDEDRAPNNQAMGGSQSTPAS